MTDKDPDWVQAEIFEAGDLGDGAAPTRTRTPPASRGSRRSNVRWAVGLLTAAALIVAMTAVLRPASPTTGADASTVDPTAPAGPTSPAPNSTSASPAMTAGPSSGSSGPAAPAPITPVTVSGSGPLLELSLDAPVMLYGFSTGDSTGSAMVMRLDLTTGTEVDTPLPPLASTGPVSLLTEPDGVIVRPLDAVPGYRVPDGEAPQPLTGLLESGGPALPGPSPGTIWIPAAHYGLSGGDEVTILGLTDVDGRDLGQSITLPANVGIPFSDGDGGAVIVAPGGAIRALDVDRYVATSTSPDGTVIFRQATGSTPIGHGRPIAARGQRFVYAPCDGDQRCALRYVAGNGDLIRAIDLPASLGPVRYGALSPDGTTLAVVTAVSASTERPAAARTSGAGTPDLPLLVLIDLTDGTLAGPGSAVGGDLGAQSLVWTPDSAWLVAASGPRTLVALSADGTARTTFTVQAPALSHLAIRPSG